MKFDAPAGPNPIDRQRVVGQPHDRIDGPLKVTGTAPYAYERHDVVPDAVYGFMLTAGIAKGRVAGIDLSAAMAAPGVLDIVTYENAGPITPSRSHHVPLLGGPEIDYYDQALGVVIANTLEQARAAAALVRFDYVAADDGRYVLAAERDSAVKPEKGDPDSATGNFDAAFARAAVRIDQSYSTPDHAHAMMEPYASTASWDDAGRLTLYTSNQMVAWAVNDMARMLGLPREKVRVVAPFIGGGFGGKLWVRVDALLAAIAARAVGRPVKLAMPRPVIYNNTTHRPATIQRIRLGADKDGVIDAVAHEVWSGNIGTGGPEIAAIQTRQLYRGAHRLTTHRLAALDLPEGNAMRAPGEAVGMLALEIAMDELAEACGVDPVEIRIRNDIDYDPEQGPSVPFSQRRMADCLRIGAERFGWGGRHPVPGQRREGDWLIGMGVASAYRGNFLVPSGARVRVDPAGEVTVETDMTDIGTGSYTIIAQTAAEMLGVELSHVTVRLGDSDFPKSAGSGGQFGANSSTAGVYAACVALRAKLAQKAGFNAGDAAFEDGRISAGNRSVALADAAGPDGVEAEDKIERGEDANVVQATFGAHFCEVGVNAWTGETRVRRMSGVFAAGRILNPKAARSQVIGGMTMGVGAALMEEMVVDPRHGLFINHDMAEYAVPVHADIPDQEVIFLDETDEMSSPMKAKGVGELGICGVGAAVANAIYNACGVRVRDYPITLDKLLKGLG